MAAPMRALFEPECRHSLSLGAARQLGTEGRSWARANRGMSPRPPAAAFQLKRYRERLRNLIRAGVRATIGRGSILSFARPRCVTTPVRQPPVRMDARRCRAIVRPTEPRAAFGRALKDGQKTLVALCSTAQRKSLQRPIFIATITDDNGVGASVSRWRSSMLAVEPQLTALVIVRRLAAIDPDTFSDKRHSIVQRR